MFGDWGTGSVPVREQRARSEEINVQVTRATNGLLDGAVILVADDNADARLLIRILLERCRATVMSASNGFDALNLARSCRPNLLISDISMPLMDGYELLARLRQLNFQDGVRTPAIAITADSDPGARGKATKAGFIRFLTKPLVPDRLLDTICEVLHGNRCG
jgi:CheY-like chemotaxis protein